MYTYTLLAAAALAGSALAADQTVNIRNCVRDAAGPCKNSTITQNLGDTNKFIDGLSVSELYLVSATNVDVNKVVCRPCGANNACGTTFSASSGVDFSTNSILIYSITCEEAGTANSTSTSANSTVVAGSNVVTITSGNATFTTTTMTALPSPFSNSTGNLSTTLTTTTAPTHQTTTILPNGQTSVGPLSTSAASASGNGAASSTSSAVPTHSSSAATTGKGKEAAVAFAAVIGGVLAGLLR